MPTETLNVRSDHYAFLLDMEVMAKAIEDKGYTLYSLHEGYALLQEEVEEFWEEVKAQPDHRDRTNLKLELVQIATIALRIYNKVHEQETSGNTDQRVARLW